MFDDFPRDLNNSDELAVEPKEESVPDISLLSPEQQDRYQELADKLLADESSITPAEIEELNQLLKGRPLVGPHNEFGGPDLEIPDSLVFHFKWTEQRGKLPYLVERLTTRIGIQRLHGLPRLISASSPKRHSSRHPGGDA
jgi:hypothetical protein